MEALVFIKNRGSIFWEKRCHAELQKIRFVLSAKYLLQPWRDFSKHTRSEMDALSRHIPRCFPFGNGFMIFIRLFERKLYCSWRGFPTIMRFCLAAIKISLKYLNNNISRYFHVIFLVSCDTIFHSKNIDSNFYKKWRPHFLINRLIHMIMENFYFFQI